MKYLLLIFLFLSCGTETGNPIEEDDSGQALPGDSVDYFTFNLADNVCDKLIECYSEVSDVSACIQKVLSVDGFDLALNLSSTYSDLNEIYTDEKNSTISKNSTESSQCIADIKALSCSDSEVINAFDSSSPNDYSNTANMVPTNAGSCQDALSAK